MLTRFVVALACAALSIASASAGDGDADARAPANYDAALAARLGADANGMRKYVFVVLRSGPTPVPAGAPRDAMFEGHFANIQRLSDEGKLALAGPFDGKDGWRGMFILAVADIDEAKRLVAGDPVIAAGEMIAEYHDFYGSAALMQVPGVHATITRPSP